MGSVFLDNFIAFIIGGLVAAITMIVFVLIGAYILPRKRLREVLFWLVICIAGGASVIWNLDFEHLGRDLLP